MATDISGIAGKSLGKEEFLQLFTSQLRHQDPLNPMDSSAFTAQLAQFSSLEQLFNLNKEMENLVAYQNSLNNSLATDFIGRRVVSDDGTSGTVTGIDFGAGGTTLLLDSGNAVSLGSLRQIYSI